MGDKKTSFKELLHSFGDWKTCDREQGHQNIRQRDVEKHCPAPSFAQSIPGENIKHSETDTFL